MLKNISVISKEPVLNGLHYWICLLYIDLFLYVFEYLVSELFLKNRKINMNNDWMFYFHESDIDGLLK